MNLWNEITERIEAMRRKLSRTIFTKYLFVTSAILIISFIIFGSFLAGFLSDKWQNEKQQQLSDNLNGIAQRASRYISPITDPAGGQENYQFSESSIGSMRAAMAMLGSSLGADIFLIDTHGNVFLCSEEDVPFIQPDGTSQTVCRHRGVLSAQYAASAISEALKSETGDYRTTGKMGSVYSDDHYIVGVPIISQNSESQDVAVGMVMAATSAKSVEQFRSDTYSIVLISILLASIISLVAVYIITYQQIKPLREMAAAVSKYAAGDFSVRVPVSNETEVGQLAAAFNNMASSLSASENMRRSFVANVSHELKTPMTTISGFVDGILDGTIPQDKHIQYLTTVSMETKRLARLVRSMLDLSRIDSGEMRLNKSRFDLSKSVFETLLSFEQRIEEKNIEIQGLDSVRNLLVCGDPDLIHQVVYNLLDNAVKFTNVGGFINIKVYHKERNAYVRIGNSGIGVPSDELPHIFERFYKTDKSRSYDKSGVGLGLFIVKTIISLHGGGIEARSSEGTYCEFEFHIPIDPHD